MRPSLRKLVLHFDVNETIMIADPVGGLDLPSTLNVAIAKTAYLGQPGFWHDGSSVAASPPPPLRYDWDAPRKSSYQWCHRSNSNTFTESGQVGHAYRSDFEKLHSALQWKHEPNPIFAPAGFHLVIPAFFHTLCELEKQKRDFVVTIRTFGTDLANVARCLCAFSEGHHPDFKPGEAGCGLTLEQLKRFRLQPENARWALLGGGSPGDWGTPPRMVRYDRDFSHDKGAESKIQDEIKFEAEMVQMIESTPILGIRDDYHHWKRNNYVPQAGKPLWLTLDHAREEPHHIFFDDNIHKDPNDSVVAVRARRNPDEPYRPLSGEATQALQGSVLVKAHPALAVLDKNYFLNHIISCEAHMAKDRQGRLAQLLRPQEKQSSASTPK
jgi:hypothetical protein